MTGSSRRSTIRISTRFLEAAALPPAFETREENKDTQNLKVTGTHKENFKKEGKAKKCWGREAQDGIRALFRIEAKERVA